MGSIYIKDFQLNLIAVKIINKMIKIIAITTSVRIIIFKTENCFFVSVALIEWTGFI